MSNVYECTSPFERVLAAQGAIVCLPLGEPVLADRATAGAATWVMLALAGGILLLCLLCLGRVLWRCYCPVLPLPILAAFPLQALGGLGGGDSNAVDLTAVTVVAPGTSEEARVWRLSPAGLSVPDPSVPRVPMPGSPLFLNSVSSLIPNTSTPLHTAGCRDLMPGSPLSPVSSDRSYKSALGENSDESTLAASPAAAPTDEDRVSLGRGIAEAVLADLLEAALNSSVQPLVGEAPSGSNRTWYPRQAKTSRRALYQHPENPYSRF